MNCVETDGESQEEDQEVGNLQKLGLKYSCQCVDVHYVKSIQEVGEGGSAKYTDTCSLCEGIHEGL